MRRILVTGGAGYLGSVMVPLLLQEGYDVTVLDSFLWNQNSLLDCCFNDRFHVFRGDCRDYGLLKNLVTKSDVIIPLAALVGAPACKGNPSEAQSVNSDAVSTLVSLVSSDQIILFPTTNSGYGLGNGGQFCTEESPLKPISLYGTSKEEAERTVLASGNAISFRLATVFGSSPRMRIDLLVNDFVYRAVNDRAVIVFEGDFKRNYIHVRDVARVFLHGIQHFDEMKGRVFNVGLDDANLSKLELCKKIKDHIPHFVYLESPIGEDPDKRNYIVSNARLKSTGFRTDWNLDMGIKELIKAFQIIRNKTFSNV